MGRNMIDAADLGPVLENRPQLLTQCITGIRDGEAAPRTADLLRSVRACNGRETG